MGGKESMAGRICGIGKLLAWSEIAKGLRKITVVVIVVAMNWHLTLTSTKWSAFEDQNEVPRRPATRRDIWRVVDQSPPPIGHTQECPSLALLVDQLDVPLGCGRPLVRKNLSSDKKEVT